MTVSGGRPYNPGWNLATDIPSMLAVSRMTALGAINRKESRGGHFRDDFPAKDEALGKVNTIIRKGVDGEMRLTHEPVPEMPAELQEVIQEMK